MKPIPELPDIANDDRTPARALQVQLSTRITTQPLHYRSGDEETAVSSVHALFGTTRDLLVANPKALAFDTAATFFLNYIVRPYTARWHRWIVDGRFGNESSRRQFRYELKQLQRQLPDFVDLLQLMAGEVTDENKAKAKALFNKIAAAVPSIGRHADLGGEVPAGIGPEVPPAQGNLGSGLGQLATVKEINEAEWDFVRRRRRALPRRETPERPPGTGDPPFMNATGLCLSGGGIRSATFCLGIIQVLARQRILSQFDYLSTVSGGGYIGSFLTSFLGTPVGGLKDANPVEFSTSEIEETLNQTFHAQNGRESVAIRHLRNNSRYLLHGGLWGRVKIVALLVTGILTNILLTLPIPLAGALAYIGLKAVKFWDPKLLEKIWPTTLPPEEVPKIRYLFAAETLAGNLVIWLAVMLGIAWFLLPIVRKLARGQEPKSFWTQLRAVWEPTTLILGLAAVGAGVLWCVPYLFDVTDYVRGFVATLGNTAQTLAKSSFLVSTVAPLLLGLLAARLKAGKFKNWTTFLFALSGPLLFLVVFIFVGHKMKTDSWHWGWVLGVTVVLWFWGWLSVDVNAFSPHGYYRARLCECYLAVRQADQTGRIRNLCLRFLHGSEKSEVARGTGIGTRRRLSLAKMNQTGAAPYHLVNTAANLPASHEPNLRGRDCDFFQFSRDYCGGPVCGYFKSELLEQLDPHVDLGTAMAISGAAASSNMGVKTQKQYRFLITLLNVRLGYWLRNALKGRRRWWNSPGPIYLFREMIGWMHEKTAYLNLSDGGHIENLALYELLRRRCKFIVVVDGGMEPGMECADLMMAQRYAQIDLGVRFDFDLADLTTMDPQRRSRAYAVFGKIRYSARDGQGADDLGWLVYIKLACTGGEPGYVIDYRRQNPDFPHQTTGDQIYDEAQFEAYRRLGECAAESLFRGELAGTPVDPQTELGRGDPQFSTIDKWFQALADNLLPDNDDAFTEPSSKTAGHRARP